MISWILKKILGTKNQRELKRLWPLVHRVNEIEAEYQNLSDEQLRAKTEEFRKRLADGASLDDILPEAFAAVKNTCRRLLGKEWLVRGQPYKWDMVPFDVQVLGGIVLHQGRIAEMATGEGKTLVATMPLYLNALAGQRAPGHGQRLPRRARRGVDGRGVQVPRVDRRRASSTTSRRHFVAHSTPATSRTARTPSSVSIICATTAWPPVSRRRSSAVISTPSWTKWTRS